MSWYSLAYRLGVTPWEGYRTAAAPSIGELLERESADRSRTLGRALDLGCGRGGYTRWLADAGWEAVGVDNVPRAVEQARGRAVPGSSFTVADVTDLEASGLGRFDLFLDVGCFQGLDRAGRRSVGQGVTALANAGATLLLLAFGPTLLGRVAGGVSRAEVEAAFPGWALLSVRPAETAGLGWPMSRMSPQWYRFALRAG